MAPRKTLNQQLEPSLSELSDVLIGTPANDQVLKFNGNQWVNGTAAGGSINWSGQAARTANFNSVAGSWQEVEITGSGNIIGTLPASPADNEEHLFVCRPTAADPGGRFRLGLNGKVINGRTDAATETRSTGFEAGSVSASFAQIGGSVSASGVDLQGTPWVRSGAFSLRCSNSAVLTWTMPTVVANQSVLTLYAYDDSANEFGSIISLNGNQIYAANGSGGWELVTLNLTQANNTLVIQQTPGPNWSIVDDMSLTGIAVAAPTAWTDVVPWQLNSGGRLAVRWNAAFQTWFVLEYYKGIYA